MKYVDSHNHQVGWSVDATISLASLISEAKALGLDGITLTDHYDYNGRDDNPWCLNAKAYLADMAAKRQTDKSDLLVLTGIELGYTKQHQEHLRTIACMDGFDHIILSLHFLNGLDPYLDPIGVTNGYDTHGSFVDAVINEMAYSAEQLPQANTIGHYDFFSRYVPWQKSKFHYADAPAAFDRLFNSILKNNQALEINAGTVTKLLEKGYQLDDALPDQNILARYVELGGRLVTLASDAHKPGRLGNHTDLLLEQLERFGLKPCYFIEKKVCLST